MRASLILFLLLVTKSNLCFSQAGNLDSTFSNDGFVTKGISAFDYPYSIVIEPDGGILIVGTSWDPVNIPDDEAVVLRFNAEGFLDNTFSDDGIASIYIDNATEGTSLNLQTDGKILVGCAGVFSNKADLVRLSSNGSIDVGFGSNGYLKTSFSGTISSIVIQEDGKIVAGLGWYFSSCFFQLFRSTLDGKIDSSFGTNGLTTSVFGSNGSVNAITIDSNDKIIAAGGIGYEYGDQLTLVRYTSNGIIDSSFGTNGIVTFPDLKTVKSVAIQPDNKLVVATDSNLLRLNSDGTIDSSFGTNGIVTSPIKIFSICLQSDLKIVTSGSLAGTFAVARNNSNGDIDSGFAESGLATININPSSNATCIAIQTDEKIVAVGTTGYWSTDYLVARFLSGLESGVNDLPTLENSVSVFPNPGNGVFQIQNASLNIQSIEVYNLLGEKVFSTFNSNSSSSIKINISSQNDGIYFLHLKTASGIAMKKLVIKK